MSTTVRTRAFCSHFRILVLFLACAVCLHSRGQNGPALIWITNSSVKLEQLLGDIDWETGSNTTSQTVSRFNILGTDIGTSFETGSNLITLFGDTIGSNVSYHAADSWAWSTNTDGEHGWLLNFFTNSFGTNLFVAPGGIDTTGDDTPTAGIVISNSMYIIYVTGANHDGTTIQQTHAGDYSLLLTFDPVAQTFQTNRVISATTNGGHFVRTSLHLDGTNVLMYGEGNFRNSDIYLATVPASSFFSGAGTLYFTGLSNGAPTWSTIETDAVPVVQDNPTNGPAWPNDNPGVGDLTVINPPGLGLWLMSYDGGRHTGEDTNTEGVYFSYATTPWGPWSTPQLIFNAMRDGGFGNFMFNTNYNPPGPAGPTINPGNNNPTNTQGAVYGGLMVERFTRISNSTLYVYYTMSTWNPYTVVKMRSAFDIVPVIDPVSLTKTKNKFSFSWNAPTNEDYGVDFSDALPGPWTSFTNVVMSSSGTFNFSDNGSQTGGLSSNRFYRVRTLR